MGTKCSVNRILILGVNLGEGRGGGSTFQKGSMPVGNESVKTLRTLRRSTMMNAMDRHIDSSIIPNRGLIWTSSHSPKLYSRLMVQNRETVVKTHHGSLGYGQWIDGVQV
jgi:hypothetical protein